MEEERDGERKRSESGCPTNTKSKDLHYNTRIAHKQRSKYKGQVDILTVQCENVQGKCLHIYVQLLMN